jgi:hypothetical protein
MNNVINDLLSCAKDGKTLTIDKETNELKFAIKEYTNSRFYYNINGILSREEFHKLGNYISCILRYLPSH